MTTSSTPRRIRHRLRALPPTPPPADALDADLAVRVAAAALSEHPGATVDRVEVDSAGMYTAHLVTCYGDAVVVQVDGDLTVLGWLTPVR